MPSLSNHVMPSARLSPNISVIITLLFTSNAYFDSAHTTKLSSDFVFIFRSNSCFLEGKQSGAVICKVSFQCFINALTRNLCYQPCVGTSTVRWIQNFMRYFRIELRVYALRRKSCTPEEKSK